LTNDRPYPDKVLLQLAADNDQQAFTSLYNLYSNKLYSFLLRITESPELSQDIVQNVFLKLWTDRAVLAQVENFNAYVFRMAQNQALNAFKRMANETLILSNMQKELSAYRNTQDEDMRYKEVEALLHNIVKDLPPQQNLVFKLSREQGLKHNEIATLLKISPYTVKNHLVVALRTIGEHLKNYRGIEAVLLLVVLSLFR
jgi:RNA polymerase sigma-70 factor (family 1)